MVSICRYSLRWRREHSPALELSKSDVDKLSQQQAEPSPRELVEAFLQQIFEEERSLATLTHHADESRCA